MNIIERFFDKLRKASFKYGYTCDVCGAEVFEYPRARLCDACEEKLSSAFRFCAKCGRETIADGLCLDCKADAPRFEKGFSPFVYRGETARVINLMKNGKARLAVYFGECMADYVAEIYSDLRAENVLVIPVPITKEKERERGYNQAERLSESFCERLEKRGFSVTCDTELLIKRKETKPQKQMTRAERAENVKGAFFVHKRKECRDKTILLVDDILTTGATANECTERLLAAGAKRVFFVTAAAVPERK